MSENMLGMCENVPNEIFIENLQCYLVCFQNWLEYHMPNVFIVSANKRLCCS